MSETKKKMRWSKKGSGNNNNQAVYTTRYTNQLTYTIRHTNKAVYNC